MHDWYLKKDIALALKNILSTKNKEVNKKKKFKTCSMQIIFIINEDGDGVKGSPEVPFTLCSP